MLGSVVRSRVRELILLEVKSLIVSADMVRKKEEEEKERKKKLGLIVERGMMKNQKKIEGYGKQFWHAMKKTNKGNVTGIKIKRKAWRKNKIHKGKEEQQQKLENQEQKTGKERSSKKIPKQQRLSWWRRHQDVKEKTQQSLMK